MSCNSKNTKGFTLIEVIVVVTVIAILIAVAVPKYLSLKSSAVNASSISVISNVNTGILFYYVMSDDNIFPEKLDDANVGDSPEIIPYFDVVLRNGITNTEWKKINDKYTYHAPNDCVYVYYSVKGFIK